MKIENKLKKLLTKESTIKNVVIKDALESDDAQRYLEEVTTHGCQSGMVSGLIYYNDTKKFYNDFQDEIHDLIAEGLSESLIDNQKLAEAFRNNFSNWAAWYGYEMVAYNLLNEIENA